MASPYDNIPGKIFIGGIPPITSQETIQNYFEQFGELCDCVLMQDKPTGKSRGFGFVTYRDSKIVDKVLSKAHVIDGKEVDCKRAVPRDQQGEFTKEEAPSKTRKLFVGGLPPNLSEDQFKGYFEQFGKIEDSVIILDKETGKSRGFGFITFDNEDSVEEVIQRYYENKIDGKWIECKKAHPKDTGMMPNKKGDGKFGNGGGRGGRGGYYQDNSSTRSSKSQFGQDSDDYYQGGGGGFALNNMMRNNAFESGKYPNMGYGDYNNFNASYGGMYDPNFGYGAGYPGDYSGAYGNAYGGAYNNPYGGYNQGYSGNMMYSGGQSGYGAGRGGYNAGHYGYNMQGGYPGNNDQSQLRGMQYGYSKQNQSVDQTQENAGQGGQFSQEESGVGPVKGVAAANKKQEVESRYYAPY